MKKIFLVLTSIFILLVSNSVLAQKDPGTDPGRSTITKLTSDGTTVITKGCFGSTLVIKGTNFTGATAVTVNDLAVDSYTITDATTITATLPSEAISGIVQVTTPIQTASSAGDFSVNDIVTPTFDAVATICYQGSLLALPTTSNNGIVGTWSPALNNTTTAEYTFTPNASECGTATTLTITVNPLPAAPTVACYETATWNGTTCQYDVTGTREVQPTLACYESAEFNTTTCQWDVTGTQAPAPTGLACYESAEFNTTTCAWVVSGTQPAEPTLACYETLGSFNSTTCSWDVIGTQAPAPTGLACYESAEFNTTTCAWVVSGTQAATPTGLACYESAEFNTITCAWVVSGTESKPTTVVTNAAICSGASYTWAANGQVYTTAQTALTITNDACTADQVLNLTVTPKPATVVTNATICSGASYTWAANGQAYTTAQTALTITNDGCTADQVLNLTVTPAANAGTNGTLSLSASPSEAALFAAITGEDAGGTWTSPGSGYVGVYTYTVNAIAPCTGSDTSTVTVTASSVIPTGPLSLCKGATVASVTGTTSLKFYAASTGGSPLIGTTALATKTYFVTETISGSGTRVSLSVIVNNLPATPSALVSTESALICKYIDSDTPVLFSATATGASSYIWTTTIANITEEDITNNGAEAYISFKNASTTAGLIGSVSVQIQDANGCVSLPKALALTTKVPTAPTALVMTSADSTPSFKGIITPANPLAVPPTPAVFGLLGLNTLTTGIKKVGPYTGTETVFTMTAPAAVTAASYLWTLPTGVNAIASETVAISSSGVVTSTSPVITANFAGVTPGITALPIVVQSVGGCGNSTARTLSLARSLPTAPTALTLTNSSQANLSALTKISKVGPYTGTNIAFTLTATPFTTQGAEATSYAWVLPTGVVCTTCSLTTDTTVKVKSTVNTGTTEAPIYALEDVAAFSSATSTITVKFSGVATKTTGDLLLSVYAVNGSGNSVARTLKLARALPTAPTALVLRDEAISTTVAVTKVGPYTTKETSLTLTATPFTAQGAEATSFSWVLPAGVNVTAGATLSTNNGTTKTWTGTESVLTINLNGIGTGITSIPLSVYAVNGAGTSATAKTLTVTAAAPATPTIVGSVGTTTAITFSSCETAKTYTATSIPGATYTWVLPNGATGTSTTNSIVVNYSNVTAAIGVSTAVTCYATNGTGTSAIKSLTVKRVAATCSRLAPEAASATESFSVVAYPNPSKEGEGFTISSNAKSFGVQVYDMLGRSIEQRQMTSESKIGSNYAKGVYNVIVNQGENTKSLRVIKR